MNNEPSGFSVKNPYPCKIWIVYGETGEYSDCREWSVAAYFYEELANQHRDLAQKWYEENGGSGIRMWESPKNQNPHDPNMQVDYTGTKWHVYPIMLYAEIPQKFINPFEKK